ncbi:hypothetical protein QEN19_003088 [Hanseniaspora menglaensis]
MSSDQKRPFSCSELNKIKGTSSSSNHTYKQLVNKFEMLQNLVKKFTQLPKQTDLYNCSTCEQTGNYPYHSNGLFLCLHCTYYGCNGSLFGQQQHFKEHNAEHIFGLNTNNLKLYCFHCNDYIVDFNKNTDSNILDNINYQMLFGVFKFNNFGSSCYMNTVIQSLVHNPYFNSYFLSNQHYKECTKLNETKCMSCLLVDLHALVFSGNLYNDQSMINILKMTLESDSGLKHLFNGYTQQDAHEYWQFLVNRLHLDHVENGHKNLPSYQEFSNIEDCDCITHVTFQGIIENNISCNKCNYISKKYEEFLDLSINIPEDSNVSLRNCLDNFFSKEQIKDYKYKCVSCNQNNDSILKQSVVNKFPLTLCTQLKRFKQLNNGNFIKINNFVKFDKYLEMGSYSLDNTNSLVYELSSVVVHEGNNFDTGHYIVMINMGNGIWFKFNDSKFAKIDEETVLKQTAYLLFYTLK